MQFFDFIAILVIIVTIILISYWLSSRMETRTITLLNRNQQKIQINAEIADTLPKMARGLMGRTNLPQENGMLFIFNDNGLHSFWMMNTTIKLDAIFFDENGTVVDIIPMYPCKSLNCTVYSPKSGSRYVLEVNEGYALRNAIETGNSSLQLPP